MTTERITWMEVGNATPEVNGDHFSDFMHFAPDI